MKTARETKTRQSRILRLSGIRFDRDRMNSLFCFTLCLFLLLAAIPVFSPTVSHADADAVGEFYKTLEDGTMYQCNDCFVYIPTVCSEDTACCVHFAGGTGGWLLRQDYAMRYISEYDPNAIFIWYKNSGLYERDARVRRTADLLRTLASQTGTDLSDIVITSSSNGGYTALYAASHLESEYSIETEKVVILDMGNVWAKTEFIVSQEEANEMIDMGTTVYHFGRKGETFTMKGAQQFASYGVPLVEVVCKGAGHDQITNDAFSFGVFSWAIDDPSVPLRDDWYTPANVNF